MKIYAVKLLFQYTVENENRRFYEESIRLFHADSPDEAFEKAEKMAAGETDEYVNTDGKKVKYSFYDSVGTFWLFDEPEFEDGTEVYSVYFEMENPEDDPIEKRYKCCTAEDMYPLRNAELNHRKEN